MCPKVGVIIKWYYCKSDLKKLNNIKNSKYFCGFQCSSRSKVPYSLSAIHINWLVLAKPQGSTWGSLSPPKILRWSCAGREGIELVLKLLHHSKAENLYIYFFSSKITACHLWGKYKYFTSAYLQKLEWIKPSHKSFSLGPLEFLNSSADKPGPERDCLVRSVLGTWQYYKDREHNF